MVTVSLNILVSKFDISIVWVCLQFYQFETTGGYIKIAFTVSNNDFAYCSQNNEALLSLLFSFFLV